MKLDGLAGLQWGVPKRNCKITWAGMSLRIRKCKPGGAEDSCCSYYNFLSDSGGCPVSLERTKARVILTWGSAPPAAAGKPTNVRYRPLCCRIFCVAFGCK